jgi:excisionase family DNA binding protein
MKQSPYKNYDELPLMLSVPQVAAVLGISRAGAYELVRTGGFPSLTIRSRIIVPKDEFITWVKRQIAPAGL